MKRWRILLSGLCAAAVILSALLAPAAYAAPAPVRPAQDPTPAPALPLPPADDDWQRVQAAKTLVVGTAADYEPFEFYNSNFELDGFDVALMNELGKRMGVNVVFQDFAFGGLLDALDLGQIDAAISAISVTPERREQVDFSNLYYVGDDVVLAGKTFTGTIANAADLAGLKIGVETGTTYQGWVQQNVIDLGFSPQENIKAYDDTNQIIRDLRNGTLDVALMGSLPARQFQLRFPDVRLAGEKLSQQQFAIATREGSSLINEFNRALLAIQSDGTFAELVSLYLQVKPGEVTPSGDAAQVDNTGDATPTPVPTATAAAETQPAATPTPPPTPPPPACVDGLAFIADLNYDDQNMTAPAVLTAGQPFVKSWRVQNSGTCTWEPEYALVYVNGNRAGANMGAQVAPIGRTVEPGEVIDISVSLTAPQDYGTYQGFWQMRNTAGAYFGQVMWVGITVPDPNPPPAPPPPPPAPGGGGNVNPNLRADANYINYGQCTTVRWDVDGVNAVYFVDSGGQSGVGGHDARTVCPAVTTTYILRIVRTDGATVDFPITINVGGGAPSYSVSFWADRNEIYRGECTTLRWDVQGVQAVYLNNEGVVGVGSREVCPKESKTYHLTVVRMDGGTETHDQRIKVRSLAK